MLAKTGQAARLSRLGARSFKTSCNSIKMDSMKLPKRALGSTGLNLSVLGFGASPLGGVFGDVDKDVAKKAVHDAFNYGINFFDTSPYYGSLKSEMVLGECLQGLPRSEFIVSTKVGRYGPEVADFDFSADRVTRSVRESLERLQLEYIDIIQCHDVEFGDLDKVISDTLPALAKLKEQGLVKHIGITGLPLSVFQYVLDRVEPGASKQIGLLAAGVVDSVLSYCHYSLNDSTLETIIPYLKEKGVGIVSASPLSMGLLTPQGPPSWHPAPKDVQDACSTAAAASKDKGVDISKIALAFAVKNVDISSTLVGMASPEIVASNVKTVLEALELLKPEGGDVQTKQEADALSGVESLLADVKGTTWASGKTQPGNP